MVGLKNIFTSASGWGSSALQIGIDSAKRPIEYFRYILYPRENPSKILNEISVVAKAGIQKAETAGTPIPFGKASEINEEITKTLNQGGISNNPEEKKDPASQKAADLSASEPEVTRAIPLQARVARIDWHQKGTENLRKLIDKVSVFVTLMKMRDWAGVQILAPGKLPGEPDSLVPDTNNLKIMAMVKEATEGTNPVSVWEVFTKHYPDLSLLQKFYAAIFYWCFYQTSLVTNTIDAYLNAFIDGIKTDLGSKTRTKVFCSLIENANDFLNEDIKATEAYANGTVTGLLKKIRNDTIEKHYGFSLEELCEKFCEKVMAKDPRVKILRDFHKIFLIGRLFKNLEWAINKFIIQRAMMNSILPEALKSVVEKGLEATQPDKLPFAISLTDFLLKQLQRLAAEPEMNSVPTKEVDGTELLPATIKLLIKALALEGDYAPADLKKEIQKFEQKGLVDQIVLNSIQQGIIEASNKLFSLLHKNAESGELLAQLLGLALIPFEGQEKTEASLKAEYAEKSLQLERTANTVFTNLIKNAVSYESSKHTENNFQTAKDSLASQTIIAKALVEKMDKICKEMSEKVSSLEKSSKDENSIQSLIVSLLQIMQIFDSRQEFQDELLKIDGTHRQEIWNRFRPIFTQVDEIEKIVLSLQDHSDQYMRHSSVVTHLNNFKTHLESFLTQFHSNPKHLQQPLIQSMKTAASEIYKSLGDDVPVSKWLKDQIQKADEFSQTITSAQNALDALYALYPPRADVTAPVRNPGLLEQLRNYQKRSAPSGFRPRDCITDIKSKIAQLSETDAKEISGIIGDGSNIESKWGKLASALQPILEKHSRNKKEATDSLNKFLKSGIKSIETTIKKYTETKEDDHKKIQEKMTNTSAQMNLLKGATDTISSSLTLPLSKQKWTILSVAAPLASSVGGGVLGLPFVGSFLGAALGSAGYKYLQSPTGETNHNFTRKAVIKVGEVATFALLSSASIYYFISPHASELTTAFAWAGAGMATGYLFGRSCIEMGRSYAEDKGLKKVLDIYEKAKKFSLNPRIWKAATTRALKSIADAK